MTALGLKPPLNVSVFSEPGSLVGFVKPIDLLKCRFAARKIAADEVELLTRVHALQKIRTKP
jgi:hypothetical protein